MDSTPTDILSTLFAPFKGIWPFDRTKIDQSRVMELELAC